MVQVNVNEVKLYKCNQCDEVGEVELEMRRCCNDGVSRFVGYHLQGESEWVRSWGKVCEQIQYLGKPNFENITSIGITHIDPKWVWGSD